MIIPMLCVTIFVILVVWFLLPRVARLMIHTPTAISIFVCLRSEERFSRNAETELVCRLLLEKKNCFGRTHTHHTGCSILGRDKSTKLITHGQYRAGALGHPTAVDQSST